MNERRAVEKVIERIYKDRLKRTGRLPDAKETKAIEKKAREAAQIADKNRR
ncbi:MAG: hypothetical protein HYS21_13745 [Deltaproteobacteria bacterium]|nr:hypothetical protein [Deltaproteobacteria bacterium]